MNFKDSPKESEEENGDESALGSYLKSRSSDTPQDSPRKKRTVKSESEEEKGEEERVQLPYPNPVYSSCFGCVNRIKQPSFREARLISLISLCAAITIAILGTVIAVKSKSTITLAFVAANVADMLVSMLIVWRYWGEDCDRQLHQETREPRVKRLIAVLFILCSLVLCANAITHLSRRHGTRIPHTLFAISISAGVVHVILGIIKFKLAKYLDSKALQMMGVSSFFCAKVATGLFAVTCLVHFNGKLWWCDSVVGILVSISLTTYAVLCLMSIEGKRIPCVKEDEVDIRSGAGEQKATIKTMKLEAQNSQPIVAV